MEIVVLCRVIEWNNFLFSFWISINLLYPEFLFSWISKCLYFHVWHAHCTIYTLFKLISWFQNFHGWYFSLKLRRAQDYRVLNSINFFLTEIAVLIWWCLMRNSFKNSKINLRKFWTNEKWMLDMFNNKILIAFKIEPWIISLVS